MHQPEAVRKSGSLPRHIWIDVLLRGERNTADFFVYGFRAGF